MGNVAVDCLACSTLSNNPVLGHASIVPAVVVFWCFQKSANAWKPDEEVLPLLGVFGLFPTGLVRARFYNDYGSRVLRRGQEHGNPPRKCLSNAWCVFVFYSIQRTRSGHRFDSNSNHGRRAVARLRKKKLKDGSV